MYRAVVGSLNYCSPTFEGLLYAVGYFHSIYTSFESEAVVNDPVLQYIEALRNGVTVQVRQEALVALEQTSNDTRAVNAVAYVRAKHVSFGAAYLTRCLGKRNFSQVTTWELSDLVSNIIHRGELIEELAKMVKLDA